MWALGHASQLLRSLRLWHWLPSLPGVLPFVSGLWPWSPVVLDTSSQQPLVCLGSHRCSSRRESWEMGFPWIHLVNPTHFLIFLGCGVDYPPNLNNFGKWARVFLLVYYKCHISIQLHGLQPTKKKPQDLQTLFRQVNGSAVGVPDAQTGCLSELCIIHIYIYIYICIHIYIYIYIMRYMFRYYVSSYIMLIM